MVIRSPEKRTKSISNVRRDSGSVSTFREQYKNILNRRSRPDSSRLLLCARNSSDLTKQYSKKRFFSGIEFQESQKENIDSNHLSKLSNFKFSGLMKPSDKNLSARSIFGNITNEHSRGPLRSIEISKDGKSRSYQRSDVFKQEYENEISNFVPTHLNGRKISRIVQQSIGIRNEVESKPSLFHLGSRRVNRGPDILHSSPCKNHHIPKKLMQVKVLNEPNRDYVSSAQISKKRNFSVSSFAVNSKRLDDTPNFDRITVYLNLISDREGRKIPFSFFGLYQGGDNSSASNFFKNEFHKVLTKSKYFPEKMGKALKSSLMLTFIQYKLMNKDPLPDMTLTDITIIMTLGKTNTYVGNRLVTVVLGKSKIIIGKESNVGDITYREVVAINHVK